MKAEIGTVSEGTLRPEDLIPTFLETLEELDDLSDKHIRLVHRVSFLLSIEGYPSGDHYVEVAAHNLEDLYNALDEYSPSNCYFGAHLGDGSDFGWWSVEEEFSLEALEEIPWPEN